MTETSGEDEHEEDIMVQLMFGTLCLPEDLFDGSPEVPIVGDNRSKGRQADPSWTKQPRTGWGRRQQRNRGYTGDDNDNTHDNMGTIA
jgi:hypothetical protein